MSFYKVITGAMRSGAPALRLAKAGALYFAIVFGAGFVLGPLRVLLLEPRLGSVWAVLAEVPILIAVMIWAASFVQRLIPVPDDPKSLLAMGVGALALQQIADWAVGLWLREMPAAEILANYATTAGFVYLGALAVFALMPAIVRRFEHTVPAKTRQPARPQ